MKVLRGLLATKVQQMAYLAVGRQWSAVVSDKVSDQSSSPDLPVSAFSVMCKLSQPVSLQGGEINLYSFHSSTMRSY